MTDSVEGCGGSTRRLIGDPLGGQGRYNIDGCMAVAAAAAVRLKPRNHRLDPHRSVVSGDVTRRSARTARETSDI